MDESIYFPLGVIIFMLLHIPYMIITRNRSDKYGDNLLLVGLGTVSAPFLISLFIHNQSLRMSLIFYRLSCVLMLMFVILKVIIIRNAIRERRKSKAGEADEKNPPD